MHWFFYEFTPDYPYVSSALKFLVLGTLGEWLGAVLRSRVSWRPFPLYKLWAKAAIWALLGVLIKWIFSSFVLLVLAQSERGLLPSACGHAGSLAFALAVSFQMNMFFSPFLMYAHRFLDNLADQRWNWAGMETAIYSIAWFWLPAHTVTFLLPENFRVLFAALLSVALGVILGFAKRSPTDS
ncbi:MAG: hypothetical protein WCU88_10350 [Elusimicrobiota bacterium]|jgi:hypothetical protein